MNLMLVRLGIEHEMDPFDASNAEERSLRSKNGASKMTISEEQRAVVRHLHVAQGMSKNAIARQLDLHHSSVARALVAFREDPKRSERTKSIEDYLPIIQGKIKNYPKINAKRVADILKASGYTGSLRSVQRAVRQIRGQHVARAFRQREVFAGEEAQVDWADLGIMKFGDGQRRVYLFIMVLSWSRDIYAHATFDMKGDTFARCHVYAFQHFGGIPASILYDNLKSVVLKHEPDGIVYHNDFVQFSGDYCFRPRPCNVRQPQEKGRVERAIRYLRESFFMGREFGNLPDLNRELKEWLLTETRQRRWPEQRGFTVENRLEHEIKHLIKLPEKLYFPKGRRLCRVRKIPYVHFECCRYSVPPETVGREVTLLYDDDSLEVWSDRKIIALHERSWIKDRVIEDTEHVLALAKQQSLGAPVTKRNALLRLVPSSREFFTLAQQRALSSRRLEARIYVAIANYGAKTVEQAMRKIVDAGAACIDSLEIVLSQQPSHKKQIPAHMLPHSAQNLETAHQNLHDYD